MQRALLRREDLDAVRVHIPRPEVQEHVTHEEGVHEPLPAFVASLLREGGREDHDKRLRDGHVY